MDPEIDPCGNIRRRREDVIFYIVIRSDPDIEVCRRQRWIGRGQIDPPFARPGPPAINDYRSVREIRFSDFRSEVGKTEYKPSCRFG